MQQIEGDIDNTLLYVYRDLSDPEPDESRQLRPVRRRQGLLPGCPVGLRAGWRRASGKDLQPAQQGHLKPRGRRNGPGTAPPPDGIGRPDDQRNRSLRKAK